jgi:hypothetical protein
MMGLWETAAFYVEVDRNRPTRRNVNNVCKDTAINSL